jgi:hypothetical protein
MNNFHHFIGFGLTANDLTQGIKTIEEKLNHLCPYFDELDKLFGGRQNLNPVSLMRHDEPENNHGVSEGTEVKQFHCISL